jgi:hypothetical protein
MKKFLILACVLSLLFAGTYSFAASITPTGMSQGDLVKFITSAKEAILNGATTSGTLTSGFSATQGASAVTTTTINYKINGVLYILSASANIKWTPTAVQTAGTYCYYLFTLNSSGVMKATKGTEGTTAALAGYPADAPASSAIVGGALVHTTSTAFTMGTSSFSTSYLAATPTWYNLMAISTDVGLSVLP